MRHKRGFHRSMISVLVWIRQSTLPTPRFSVLLLTEYDEKDHSVLSFSPCVQLFKAIFVLMVILHPSVSQHLCWIPGASTTDHQRCALIHTLHHVVRICLWVYAFMVLASELSDYWSTENSTVLSQSALYNTFVCPAPFGVVSISHLFSAMWAQLIHSSIDCISVSWLDCVNDPSVAFLFTGHDLIVLN